MWEYLIVDAASTEVESTGGLEGDLENRKKLKYKIQYLAKLSFWFQYYQFTTSANIIIKRVFGSPYCGILNLYWTLNLFS